MRGGEKLNAMMMSSMVNVGKTGNGEGFSLAKKESAGKSESFIHALEGLMKEGKETNKASLSAFSLESSEEKDFIAQLMEIDPEELLKVLYKLLEEIPTDEGFIPEDILMGEKVAAFLDVLPESWKKDLEELMDSYVSIEGLMEEFETTGDPVILLAIITSFTVKEQQGLELKSGNEFQALQQLVAAYFPQAIQGNEKTSILHQVFNQLKEFFAEAQNAQVKTAPLQVQAPTSTLAIRIAELAQLNQLASTSKTDLSRGQAKLDFQPSTLTTRIAELAHQNQLASSSAKPVVRDNQSPVLFDTSNSHMARLQQFMVHTGESQTERPQQEQFIRQFQSMLAKSSFQQLSNGVQQLNLKLNPASLGRLDITIQQVNGVLVAKMMTTTAVARDLIEGQIQHLKNAFQSQNIQVDKIEVTQQQSQQTLKDLSQGNPKEEQTAEQQSDREKEESEEEDILDFAEFLEATINTEV